MVGCFSRSECFAYMFNFKNNIIIDFFIYIFRGYGKDALLLSVLAYNVGPYAILGTSKRPKSRLLRKIERGDRNIYNDYIAFCRWHGRPVKSIKFRRQVEFDLFFVK